MRNRVQLLVLAAAASIWLTACGQEGSLSSILPTQDRQDSLPAEETAISFDDVLSTMVDLGSSAQNSITVRNQTDTLIDDCALSPEALKALVTTLREAQPIAIKQPLKAAERGCIIEWRHDDVLITLGTGVVGGEKYTAVAIEDRYFMADYALYTAWIESFASVK